MNRKGGKPPIEYQFKKGEVRNPTGRPRGTGKKRTSAFDIIAQTEFTVRTGEATETLSAEEALQFKTYDQAIKGDKKAWAEVLDMVIAREKAIDAMGPGAPRPKLLIESGDPNNAFEAMVLLGIATYDLKRGGVEYDPENGIPYLLLEPWGVQEALQRRSLSRLSESNKLLVGAWTRDYRSLKWPKRFGYV
jgi:hypothetical protein